MKSPIKEQKSYKVNRLVIHLNCKEHCFDLLVEPIKYFSYIYDEIIIQSSKNIDKIRNIFDYDNTIKYNIELTGLDIRQNFTFPDSSYTRNDINDIMNITEENLQMF